MNDGENQSDEEEKLLENSECKFQYEEAILVENSPELFPFRLMFRIKDSGSAEGYIKEPCFSSGGRYIISPYFNGLRIFDFVDGINQTSLQEHSKGLTSNHELYSFLSLVNTHTAGVLTTSCHPYLPIIASGGMDGRVFKIIFLLLF